MTPAEFRAMADLIGLSQKRLGREHLGKSVRTVRRYLSGEVEIPPLVAEKMVALAKKHTKRTAA